MRSEIQHALVEAARASRVTQLAQTVASALLRPGVVLARVWVADAGDLLLAGSCGAPAGGGMYSRLDGQFGRISAGVGKIGHIAETATPLVVRSIRGDEEWLVNPGWIARQGVRAFLGYPLIASDEVVGVLAVFDRAAPSDATLDDVQFLADYAAARVIGLREREALHAQMRAHRTAPATPDAPIASASARASLHASFGETSPERPEGRVGGPVAPVIVTRADLRSLEKQTIEAALAQTQGRVFGPRGAAMILGMKPTTLASRIKALGIR